jgi:hypothetical protein
MNKSDREAASEITESRNSVPQHIKFAGVKFRAANCSPRVNCRRLERKLRSDIDFSNSSLCAGKKGRYVRCGGASNRQRERERETQKLKLAAGVGGSCRKHIKKVHLPKWEMILRPYKEVIIPARPENKVKVCECSVGAHYARRRAIILKGLLFCNLYI